MKTLKRLLLTVVFVVAFVCGVCSFGIVFASNSGTTGVVYDISDIFDTEPGGEMQMQPQSVFVGNPVNYGDTVRFAYKMRADKYSKAHYARSAFGIGSYGIYFKCSDDTFDVLTCVLTDSSITRGTKFATLSRLPFAEYNEMFLKTEKKDENTVTLTLTYHNDDSTETIAHDFVYDSSSDMKFRFGDTDIPGNTVKSVAQAPVFGNGTFSYASEMEGINRYGGCTLSVIDSKKATEKGVPEGFTGNVLKMNSISKESMDMVFDFSALNYKRKFITGLSFRVYIVGTASDNSKHPEFRIPVPGTDIWVLGGGVGANKTDEWITVTLTAKQLDNLCVDGYLKAFAVCLRTNDNTTMYIDKVELTTIELEREPPVIIAPVTEFKVTEGAYPVSKDEIATITDNSGEVFVEYKWSDGALDDFGRLKIGTHTCTVIATDRCDNASTIEITYIVEALPETPLYKIIFRVEDNDFTVEYCEDEIDYIKIPDVPQKEHYTFGWEDFTFDKLANQVVNGVYAPLFIKYLMWLTVKSTSILRILPKTLA